MDEKKLQTTSLNNIYIESRLLHDNQSVLLKLFAALHAVQTGHSDKVLLDVGPDFILENRLLIDTLSRSNMHIVGAAVDIYWASEQLICGCGAGVSDVVPSHINKLSALATDMFVSSRISCRRSHAITKTLKYTQVMHMYGLDTFNLPRHEHALTTQGVLAALLQAISAHPDPSLLRYCQTPYSFNSAVFQPQTQENYHTCKKTSAIVQCNANASHHPLNEKHNLNTVTVNDISTKSKYSQDKDITSTVIYNEEVCKLFH